jgi:hypothetical protein
MSLNAPTSIERIETNRSAKALAEEHLLECPPPLRVPERLSKGLRGLKLLRVIVIDVAFLVA